MSTDLHTQLAEYGRYQRSERRPVELSDIQAAVDAARPPVAPSPNHTTKFGPDERELIMIDAPNGETATARMNWRSRPRLGMLAAAAAVILIGGIVLFNSDDSTRINSDDSTRIDLVDTPTDVDDSEPTEQFAPEIPVFGRESSLAVVEDYLAAHNGGDIDSVFALFTADATYSDSFSSPMDRSSWEPRFAWDLAQGETLVSPDCGVVNEVAGTSVTISCTFGTLDAIGLAVNAVEIPTTAEMTITPDGISDLYESFGAPDFLVTGGPFLLWMDRNHPEDADAVDCCEADTVEESIARGELRAQYAAEWAVYIKTNECTYLDRTC